MAILILSRCNSRREHTELSRIYFICRTDTAIIVAEEQQAQNSSMEQEVETSREGSSAPLAGNASVEPPADDSDDSL